MDIVEAYKAEYGRDSRRRLRRPCGTPSATRTIEVIADGSDCLARLWQGAWQAGGGDKTIDTLDAIAQDALAGIYGAKTFLQSETLATIAPVLATGNGGADGSALRGGKRMSSASSTGDRGKRKKA